jgi:hypothetical protein
MTAPIIERTAHTAASRASNRPAKIARALGLPKSEPLSPRPDFCSFSNASPIAELRQPLRSFIIPPRNSVSKENLRLPLMRQTELQPTMQHGFYARIQKILIDFLLHVFFNLRDTLANAQKPKTSVPFFASYSFRSSHFLLLRLKDKQLDTWIKLGGCRTTGSRLNRN